MFEPQRSFDVTWAFTTKKETAYGTALADGDLTLRVTTPQVEAARISKTFRSDQDHAGKGHEFTTELEEVNRDLRRATTFDASSLTLAWVAAFGMGKVATTQPNPGGNPTAYDHAITLADIATTGKHAPTTTVYEELTAGLKRRLVSLACNDFALTGRATDPVQLTANWTGSGQTTDGALSPLPSLTSQSFFLGADADILFGPPSAAVSIKDRVLEWSLRVSQNLESDLGYHPGSGKNRGRLWVGPRRVSASLTLFAQETDDLETLFLGDTVRELQIVLNGDQIGPGPEIHKAVALLPAVRVTSMEEAVEGNHLVHRIEFGEPGVLMPASGEPLTLTVTNTQSSLLS